MKGKPTLEQLRFVQVLDKYPRRFNPYTIRLVHLFLEKRQENPRTPLTGYTTPTFDAFALLFASLYGNEVTNLPEVYKQKDGAMIHRLIHERDREFGGVTHGRVLNRWNKIQQRMFDLTLEAELDERDIRIKSSPPFFYKFPGEIKVGFGSFGERKTGILGDDLGLISPLWEEKSDVHVPTHGRKSVDWRLVEKPGSRRIYLELHPWSGRDTLRKKPLHNLSEVVNFKRQGLLDSGLSEDEFRLFVIEKPSDLYEVIVDPEVFPLLRLSEGEFSKQVFEDKLRHAHRLSVIYDVKEKLGLA